MYYINETDIKLFEFAIIYFSKYGKENFKKDSYKLNWFSIFTIVVYNGGYYNNLIEYDELSKAFNSNDENLIKEKAFKYFDKIVENGENISKLFIFKNKEDSEKYKKIEKIKYIESQKNKFNSIKCFKCKHFNQLVTAINNDTIELSVDTAMKIENCSFDEIKYLYLILHKYNCNKRKEIVDNLSKNDTYPFDKELRINKKIEENNEPDHFKFFEKDNRLIKNWTLKPLNINCECKYFEKSDITFEEFIEKYYEI